MKLGLGTVQFGMPYGINNKKGVPSEDEVKEILRVAEQEGLKGLDTSANYGKSEEVLGRCLSKNHSFHIITKTPVFHKKELGPSDAEQLEKTFTKSLKRLQQSSLYGLLIHDPEDATASNPKWIIFLWGLNRPPKVGTAKWRVW